MRSLDASSSHGLLSTACWAPLSVPAGVQEASGGTAGEMGRCGTGHLNQVPSKQKENLNPTEGRAPLVEDCLMGCFRRLLYWTEEEQEGILDFGGTVNVVFRYVRGGFRDSWIYLKCKR